jgi:hypothetical protein
MGTMSRELRVYGPARVSLPWLVAVGILFATSTERQDEPC